MSVIGIAREVAAITGSTLRLPSVSVVEMGPAIEDLTSVTVEGSGPVPLLFQLGLSAMSRWDHHPFGCRGG